MSFAKISSAQNVLLKAHIVDVEVDTSRGLHSFSIVGLPDKAVEESKDRVSAAIKNTGFESPKSKNQKIVISLAPADLKKEGPAFDVPIALAYLLAEKEISFDPKHKLFVGELSLTGEFRAIAGILTIALEARKRGFKELYVPYENREEASVIDTIEVYGVKNLRDLVHHLDPKLKEKGSVRIGEEIVQTPQTRIENTRVESALDFGDIEGQETAKRGLEIASAGGHNIALFGPPGTGKTMLAKAFAGILPELTFDEILEISGIHSIAGSRKLITLPPVRTPHHTSSYVSLVGGGAVPKPGEVTLAHGGVLFLDEFPEFDRKVIDALRQPLEDRVVTISRAKGTALFPAKFILIAAMNPCPCGNYGSVGKVCICSPLHLSRYQRKISGPIIDRIDMWIEVSTVDYEKLSRESKAPRETESIRNRVLKAREFQYKRFEKTKLKTNSDMSAQDIKTLAPLTDDVSDILKQAAQRFGLSARAYHRLIKLARTIADLEGSEDIESQHMLEALQYRPKQNG